MKAQLNTNEVATLETVLLGTLDEAVFFSKISKFILDTFKDYKVQVYEAYQDETTVLRAENGKSVNKSPIIEKGQGLQGYVLRTKRAYYSNSKRDPIISTNIKDEKAEGALATLISSEGVNLGAIVIISDDANRKFSEEDVAIINEILNKVSNAIANMRIYLIAKNLNRELLKKLENQGKTEEASNSTSDNFAKINNIDFAGHSKEIVDVLSVAKKVAAEDFPVLIAGQIGTGKKLLAKKIHSMSKRANAPVVVVHCAAIDEVALELELFGTRDQKGLIARTTGGTLIFDCIDELSTGMQSKILRVLMSSEIYPVNSKTALKVNVRIISTTKKDLESLVAEGRFREDLYYRLNIVHIDMPTLKDRAQDVKILAESFLNQGKAKGDLKMLTSSALDKLMAYNWPGNVQELKNLMERTYITTSERFIDAEHLPTLVVEEVAPAPIVVEFVEMTLHDLEKDHICKTLDYLDNNKTRAAKSLGITVKTLYNKLHSYGLVRGKMDL